MFPYTGTKGNASGKNCQSLQEKKNKSGNGRPHRLPATLFFLLTLLGPFYLVNTITSIMYKLCKSRFAQVCTMNECY